MFGSETDTLSLLEASGCNLHLFSEICQELEEFNSGEFLDIGCGTGIFAQYLEASTGLTAFGTEVCDHAYKLASRRIRCHRVQGIDLPFSDGKFDLVTANNVMMMIDSKRSWYSEIFRVLRVGGKFATVMPTKCDYLEKPLYSYIPGSRQSSMSRYGTLEEALEDLREAGFAQVKVRRISLGTVEVGDRYIHRHRSGYFSNSESPQLTAGRLAGLAEFSAHTKALAVMGFRMHYDLERTLLIGEKCD